MLALIRQSIVMTALLALLLCGAYPLAVWTLGAAVFPHAASGSLIEQDGRVVGSRLIGQSFARPEYFHGRPSAAGPSETGGYDASASSGSNLGPTNAKLIDRIADDARRVLAENPGLEQGRIPTDLVTASASGLDPHLSPAAALVQVARVAEARGLPLEKVRGLVEKTVEGPQFGLFGEPRVNVLELNLALDGLR